MRYIMAEGKDSRTITVMGSFGVKSLHSSDPGFPFVELLLEKKHLDEDRILSLMDRSRLSLWELTPNLVYRDGAVLLHGEKMPRDVFDLILKMVYSKEENWVPVYNLLTHIANGRVQPQVVRTIVEGNAHIALNGDVLKRTPTGYFIRGRAIPLNGAITTVIYEPCPDCLRDERKCNCS